MFLLDLKNLFCSPWEKVLLTNIFCQQHYHKLPNTTGILLQTVCVIRQVAVQAVPVLSYTTQIRQMDRCQVLLKLCRCQIVLHIGISHSHAHKNK